MVKYDNPMYKLLFRKREVQCTYIYILGTQYYQSIHRTSWRSRINDMIVKEISYNMYDNYRISLKTFVIRVCLTSCELIRQYIQYVILISLTFNKISPYYVIITCFRQPSIKCLVMLWVQHKYVRHSFVRTIAHIYSIHHAQIHDIIYVRF